jgi:hypothetical protein
MTTEVAIALGILRRWRGGILTRGQCQDDACPKRNIQSPISSSSISLSSTLCLVRLGKHTDFVLNFTNSFASWAWERDTVKLNHYGKEEITA